MGYNFLNLIIIRSLSRPSYLINFLNVVGADSVPLPPLYDADAQSVAAIFYCSGSDTSNAQSRGNIAGKTLDYLPQVSLFSSSL